MECQAYHHIIMAPESSSWHRRTPNLVRKPANMKTLTMSHCGKALKSHFSVEFSIDVSDLGRWSLSKKFGEFSKNTLTQ